MYMGQSRDMSGNTGTSGRRVGELVSRLLDLFCPNAGFTALKWLEQGCCVQPVFNVADVIVASGPHAYTWSLRMAD